MPVVELYGRARLLAGERSVEVAASTVGEAMAILASLHPELVGPVLEAGGAPTPAYTLNLNGTRFCTDPAEPLAASDELLLISSLAGG
ncbi:MAG TPA: MoaD/ThiS family protein [Chloroflexota bacterium]